MVSVVSSPSGVQHAPPFAKGGAKQMKDASSATELWKSAMREQLRREQQRRRMVKWRKQKKEKKTDMVEERRRLEKKLQRHVVAARVASDTLTSQATTEAYRLATIECVALTSENVALKEAIEEKIKFNQLIERETQEFLNEIGSGFSLPTPMDDDSWRVQFPDGAPSFYYTPFTKDEFDDILNGNDALYSERHPCTATVGKILGWTVDYAPLARTEAGNSFMAHARFSRRIRCTLDASETILPHLDKNLWPVLVTPRSWGLIQSGNSSCQTLQSFHENAHVLACNIPGQHHLRYVVLARHTREKTLDGKRMDKYVLTVADSEANRRNREAEKLQESVHWILEGGMYTTITEVDDSTIDVVVDQWGGCLSEVHGRELYIDWIRFPVCLEQCISPSRLICQ